RALLDQLLLEDAILERLQIHGRLIGLDLRDHIALRDRVAHILQPLRELALLHRVGESRHRHLSHQASFLKPLAFNVSHTTRVRSSASGIAANSSGFAYGNGTSAAATRRTGASNQSNAPSAIVAAT